MEVTLGACRHRHIGEDMLTGRTEAGDETLRIWREGVLPLLRSQHPGITTPSLLTGIDVFGSAKQGLEDGRVHLVLWHEHDCEEIGLLLGLDMGRGPSRRFEWAIASARADDEVEVSARVDFSLDSRSWAGILIDMIEMILDEHAMMRQPAVYWLQGWLESLQSIAIQDRGIGDIVSGPEEGTQWEDTLLGLIPIPGADLVPGQRVCVLSPTDPTEWVEWGPFVVEEAFPREGYWNLRNRRGEIVTFNALSKFYHAPVAIEAAHAE